MNALKTQGVFATPENMVSFERYLEKFTGSEAVVAITCAGMSWNLCCQYMEENNREILQVLTELLGSVRKHHTVAGKDTEVPVNGFDEALFKVRILVEQLQEEK